MGNFHAEISDKSLVLALAGDSFGGVYEKEDYSEATLN